MHPANEPKTKVNGASKDDKKEKKKKERVRKTADQDSIRQDPPYISYLKEYRSSRATWKFNKNHQNKLLSNLFNTYRIPFLVSMASDTSPESYSYDGASPAWAGT